MLSTRPRSASGAISCTSELSVENAVVEAEARADEERHREPLPARERGADGARAEGGEGEEHQPAAALGARPRWAVADRAHDRADAEAR